MSQRVRAASPGKEFDVAPELIPLLRLVTRAEGFALAFLECNVPVEAERGVAELSEALKRQGRRCRTLSLREAEEDLHGRIRSIRPPMRPREALFVLGFERAIPSRVEFPPALTRLNRDRERFRELPFPLVLVLPRYALDQLSREAPDFWAWRSGVFEVRVQRVYLEQMLRSAVEQENSDYENLSASRKQDHLEVLQGLLAELEAQGSGSESERADMYQRIAGLLLAMDRWLDALEWYRKSLRLDEKLGNRAGMAASYHQMGIVAHLRGFYDEALEWYRKALQIAEELGDRAGMAASYHQMGTLAHARGSYDQALEWYRKSLRISEELDNRASMAYCYHQIGRVAQESGSYDEALEWYRKSLRIREELGNRADMAASYHHLGMVAQGSGSYEEAQAWYLKSLRIDEELGNRADMAPSYGQLGEVAQLRGSYDEALEWYRKALQIDEELGNRAGIAEALSHMGTLFTERGAPEEAVPLNLKSLAIRIELQTPDIRIDLHWLGRQRALLSEERFREIIVEHMGGEGAESVLEMLDRASKE